MAWFRPTEQNQMLSHAPGPAPAGPENGPDEGDVLDGAAGLGEAWAGQLLCAGHVVRPVTETRRVQRDTWRTRTSNYHSFGF